MSAQMKRRDPNKVTFNFRDPAAEPKLRNLILYIATKCAEDKYFGTVKLNKILFFSDFLAYAVRGSAITGGAYLALDAGPAPRRMPGLRDQMIEERQIAEQVRTVGGGYAEKRIVATEKPDLSFFHAEEIALVDEVISALRKKTASDVSYLSHGRPWKLARKSSGEIPYESIFVSNRPPTESQIARGRELIEKYGWGA